MKWSQRNSSEVLLSRDKLNDLQPTIITSLTITLGEGLVEAQSDLILARLPSQTQRRKQPGHR